MSWDVFNVLKRGAKPIWLYYFNINGVEFYYTSSGNAINTPIGSPNDTFLAAQEWLPRAVNLGSLKRAQSTSKTAVTVTLPKSDEVSTLILNSVGIDIIKISVWQGFVGDPDSEYVSMFIGTPQQIKPSYKTVGVVCMDRSVKLTNKALARVVQASCPYEVFGRGCKANAASYVVLAVADSMASLTLNIPAAAAHADGYFNRGRLTFNGVQQTIAVHVGASITLVGRLSGLQQAIDDVGTASVELLPGCRKSLAYCVTFDNTDNFGGFSELLTSPYTGDGIL